MEAILTINFYVEHDDVEQLEGFVAKMESDIREVMALEAQYIDLDADDLAQEWRLLGTTLLPISE